MLRLLQRLLGRPAKNQLPPFNFARNRYQAQRKWPPNLRALTEKQQFRFERKFKRRLRLKSIKPQWQKWTKIVQWSMISFVVVYGVFFHDFAKDPMNPRPGEQPFKGLREKMWNVFGNFWTHTAVMESRERGLQRQEPPEVESENAAQGRDLYAAEAAEAAGVVEPDRRQRWVGSRSRE